MNPQRHYLVLFALAFVCLSAVSLEAFAEVEAENPVLWDLKITGNLAVKTGRIKEAISTSDSSHLWGFFGFPFGAGERRFDPIAFAADRKRIEHLYQRTGYYQSKIKVDVQPCSKPGRVCATIDIQEGNATRIASLAVRPGKANPPVSEESLRSSFGMQVGQIFDHDKYLDGKNEMIAGMKRNAYPLPKVQGQARYDRATNSMDLELKADPGTSARIGLISFEGLDRILPEDVMRRLPIQTGDRYDPSLFEDAEDLLGDLDIFRTIEVELNPRAGAPDTVDVVYRVREKALKTLQFGVGVGIENSRQEARFRAEWLDRNFHKRLRRFNVRAEPRYALIPSLFDPQQSGPLGNIEVSVTQPAFLSPWQDLRAAIGLDSALEQGFRWFGPRLNTSLQRRLSRFWTVSGGYSFRYLKFYSVDLAYSPSSRLVPAELLFNRNYRLGFIDQKISWDGRDQPLEPYRGAYAQLSLAESAPPLGSAFTYLRIDPELRGYLPHYFPKPRRATLASRVSYGYLIPFGGRSSPITERFYGGGSNSHRGFAYHRLSPQVRDSEGRFVPVGGNLEFFFSLEERMDLIRLGNHWLIGAVFLDGGDVVESPADLDFKRLHFAVGPGLRYNTPLGIIRADVGFRINRLDESTLGRPNPDPGSRLAVHVSFGESF